MLERFASNQVSARVKGEYVRSAGQTKSLPAILGEAR